MGMAAILVIRPDIRSPFPRRLDMNLALIGQEDLWKMWTDTDDRGRSMGIYNAMDQIIGNLKSISIWLQQSYNLFDLLHDVYSKQLRSCWYCELLNCTLPRQAYGNQLTSIWCIFFCQELTTYFSCISRRGNFLLPKMCGTWGSFFFRSRLLILQTKLLHPILHYAEALWVRILPGHFRKSNRFLQNKFLKK